MTEEPVQLFFDFYDDALLTTKEAAQYLNITTKTLESWRQSDSYLRYTKIGKSVRYLQSDLRKFVADGIPAIFMKTE